MSDPEAFTRFHLTYAQRPVGRLAVLTMDNGADHTRPSTFDARALASLSTALDALEADDEVVGLLVTGKPFIFAAGADLHEFVGMDAAGARAAARAGHALFSRLQALPCTTVAAINGVCLGGGLELALHCDARTLSTGARMLGFPEVFLSIFPAWGGTQLAPRLVGAPAAIQTIVVDPLDNNRTMRPAQALERGFVDRLYDGATFLDDSVELLERLVGGEESLDRAAVDPTDGLEEALAHARAVADGRTGGATRAPYVALELIEHAARGGDLEEGRRREQELLAELLPARQAQASVYAFGLVQQRVKRQPGRPDAAPRPVRRAAIVGAGLMGAQLAALHLQRLEVPLVVKDVDEAVLDRCRGHVEGELDRQVERGRLAEGRARFLKGLVDYTTSMDALADADWVLEAVPERLEVKQRVLAEVERVVDPGAVLATNTSSLSVAQMASALAHPSRLVGFHLFNPVAILPLVELIRWDGVADTALATAFELAGRLRKSAVLCADAPAFVVNRLLLRSTATAMAALRRGSSPQEIDDAMRGLGLPMGPFVLLGLVGPQVVLHTAETLAEAFGERFAVDDHLRAVVATGLPGIYDWEHGGVVHPEVAAAIEVDPDASPPSAEEIRRSVLEATADEARRMLDEGVVADARDLDTALLLGAGWPFFNGGVCKLLDQTGVSVEVSGRTLLTDEDAALG